MSHVKFLAKFHNLIFWQFSKICNFDFVFQNAGVLVVLVGSDNGLSPAQHQAIIWTNAGILLISPLGTNFSETLITIQTFCLGLSVLMVKRYLLYSYLFVSIACRCYIDMVCDTWSHVKSYPSTVLYICLESACPIVKRTIFYQFSMICPIFFLSDQMMYNFIYKIPQNSHKR